MSDETSGAGERFAIGISFGNTSSSIARINPEGKPEVIANEEGGSSQFPRPFTLPRPLRTASI
jgi:molecular chaperone DnaK (HSP70)